MKSIEEREKQRLRHATKISFLISEWWGKYGDDDVDIEEYNRLYSAALHFEEYVKDNPEIETYRI